MSESEDRIRAAPEAYRARAQSTAGLVSTGAAAIGAATVFGGLGRLPSEAGAAAVVAIFLLLASVVAYAMAAQYARRDSSPPDQLEARAKEIVGSIVARSRFGALFALLAVVALAFLVATAAINSRVTQRVDVVIAKMAEDDVLVLCPELGTNRSLRGRVQPSALDGSGPFIAISVKKGECTDRSLDLQLPRSSIAAIVGVNGEDP